MLKFIHFADDTTLYLYINPSDDHTSLINSELAQVQTWKNANKLSLNVQKSNYMIISNRNQIENINISTIAAGPASISKPFPTPAQHPTSSRRSGHHNGERITNDAARRK